MKVQEIVQVLEDYAPLSYQENYDNAGLQVGSKDSEVNGVLLCLDVTESVLREAVERHCELIIAHHPLVFRALRQLTEATLPERCVRYAIKHDLTLYASHTNLDNAQGGVNFEIAKRLQLRDVAFLQTVDGKSGSGVVGQLPEPMSAEAFLKMLKDVFAVESLQHNCFLNRPIRKVALCGGAGEFLLSNAVALGADAFVTGEMHYHSYFGWEGQIQLAVLGHYQSEQYTKNLLEDILHARLPDLRIELTSENTNPIYNM